MENLEEEKIVNVTNNKNKKIYALNIVLIIAIFIGIFAYMLNVEGIDNITKLLQTADYKWVFVGMLCLIGMWIAEAISIHIPIKKLYPKQKMSNSFKITMIGQLFNNLTPFASGGQPMQAYVMYKEGKRPSNCFSILTMRFVITQTILIIFTLLVVFSQFSFFASIFKDLVWLGVLGILINILVVIVFFLAGTRTGFLMKIAKPIINLCSKIHIGRHRLIKNKEEKIEGFSESVDNFSKQFKAMQKQKSVLLYMAIFGLLQTILYYAITYCVYKAFGNSGATFLQIITTQAFLMLIMTVFPTPGAGIGAEGGFLFLFGTIFQNGTINLSILFWRIYVFYIPVIMGTLFFIPTKKKNKIE